jgi:hypothetical protein
MFLGAMTAVACLLHSVTSVLTGASRASLLDLVYFTLAAPGLLLSLPLYFVLGGVHGNFFNVVPYAMVPSNAVAYGALFMLFRALALRLHKYFSREEAGRERPPY